MKLKFLKLLALSLIMPFLIAFSNYIDREDVYMSKNEAVEFAKQKYDLLKKAVNEHYGKNPLQFLEVKKKCFGTNKNGVCYDSDASCIESDLTLLNIPLEKDFLDCISMQTYFGVVAEYALEHKDMSFDYSMVGEPDYDVERQPHMSKSEKPNFCFVTFKKKWTIGGKETIVYEEAQVDVRNKGCYVWRIKPSSGSEGSSINIHKKPSKKETFIPNRKKVPDAQKKEPQAPTVMNSSNETKIELEELKMFADASYLYKEKKYTEALELYKEITIKYPDNDEAWHALGAMYFKNEGVSLSRKQRREKSAECLRKSKLKKSCRALAYVTDGREGCYK